MSCEIINNATPIKKVLKFNVTRPERGWAITVSGTATPGEKRIFMSNCVLTDAIRRVGRGSADTEESLTKMPCRQCGKCINADVKNTGLPAGM